MSTKLVFNTILDRLDMLETAVLGQVRRRFTKRALAEREGVSTRTIDRRVADGTLPPPVIINRRTFWWSDELDRHKKGRGTADTATARAARNPQLRKPALEI